MELHDHDQKEVKKLLSRLSGDKEEGRVGSRYVILIACAVLLVVASALFFFVRTTTQAQPVNLPLTSEMTPPVSPQEWDARLNDIGSILHPELASSTKKAGSSDI